MALTENPKYIETSFEIDNIKILARVDENLYAEGNECAVLPHSHSHYEICYFESGNAELLIEDKSEKIVVGDLFIIPPFKNHSKPQDSISYDLVQFSLGFQIIEENKSDYSFVLSDVVHFNNNNKYITDLFHMLRQEIINKKKGFDIYIQSLLSIIIIEILRTTNKQKNSENHYSKDTSFGRIAKIERYFGLYHTKKITLKSLGEYLGLSSRQVSRILSNEYGTGFTDKLTEERLNHAKYLLAHTADKIENIALVSGFQSYNYFSYCFKVRFGITPLEYRNNLSGKS